ncbi:MAG: oligosaccharide flippase family protein [Proteobacteria bacterium]|nr:oligosaccharide flippase family protein [Pseudomonadota bacterium]MBU1739420.1 oligosaccharide flippase family protein [Pseudomonadota bacterium]
MDDAIKRNLFSGGLWVVGLKILALPIGLILVALLTRMLSAEEMGVYFLCVSLMDFLVLFSLLGMERSIVRIISGSLALAMPGRARQAIRRTLSIGALSAMVAAALLLSGFGRFVSVRIFNSVVMGELISYLAVWLALVTLQRLIAESFRGLHDTRLATLFDGLIPNFLYIAVLATLFLLEVKIDINTALLILICTYAVNILAGSAALFQSTSRLSGAGSIHASEILKTSWPFCFSAIFLTGLQQGHLWLLGYYSTAESVALYGAAWRVVILLTATLQIVRLVIPAMVAKLYAEKKHADLEKVLRSTATIAGVPSIIALLFILIFGKTILHHLYGESYAGGNLILTILAVANIINLCTGVPGVLLMMSSKEKVLLAISIFSGSLSILVSFVLIGRYDYIGVAIGAGTGIAVQNLLMAGYCLKKMRINTFISLKEICLFKENLLSVIAVGRQRFLLKTNYQRNA